MTKDELLRIYPSRWTQIVQLTLDNMSEYHDLNELDTWEMAHKIVVALTAAMDTDISNK